VEAIAGERRLPKGSPYFLATVFSMILPSSPFMPASVDTRVRDLASDKVVQLGKHLVGDGVPHRLSVAASSHPAAAQARVAADDEDVA
jgi:hypothetical protein